MQDRLTEILLYVLAAIVGLFLLVALLDWLLPGAATFMDWTQIVLSLVTILAIVFGGFFAAVKFELFRDFEPHLTISHTINHRPLGDSYVHIDVRAVLHNSSRVRVELTDGYFVVQRIAPLSEENELSGSELVYPFWPVLEEASIELGDEKIVLEPGQSLQEVLQFTVTNEVHTVLIHYSFSNSIPAPESPVRWGITDVYDIID